ncbi:MAG: putative essential recombination function protein [Prokaryotic dsDNA virus sp.]|nr:MAG: putative essential recombination function protein [Prokaryotic dsDNA virus sp.]|tara:strand:- start:1143 stop:1931 length:789 start_codon:yes stop_codon:yes gene_type:complete
MTAETKTLAEAAAPVVANAIAQRAEHMPSATTLTPMEMIDRAIQSGAGVETLERLMALQERWEASQGKKAFDRAIADAKAEIPTIRKNRRVNFTTQKGTTDYRHEDMAEIVKTVDPILSAHGLSYRYRTGQDGNTVTVTCILSHREGYSEETTLSSASDTSGNKNHLQAVGSAATYLQRYTLKMALGLAATADDDAAAAGRDQVDTITAEQVAELRRLLAEAGRSEDGFCKVGKVDALEDIAAADFASARGMLLRIIEKGAA